MHFVIYIKIYIYIERETERERGREGKRERKRESDKRCCEPAMQIWIKNNDAMTCQVRQTNQWIMLSTLHHQWPAVIKWKKWRMRWSPAAIENNGEQNGDGQQQPNYIKKETEEKKAVERSTAQHSTTQDKQWRQQVLPGHDGEGNQLHATFLRHAIQKHRHNFHTRNWWKWMMQHCKAPLNK